MLDLGGKDAVLDGLAVGGGVTQATGTAECEAALAGGRAT
jgi:hypothetical protein